ncbi:MAG: hypothetical protein LBH44_08695 [Treponema sp.]|jgi:Leucine-rich repeat (LRR) protein|nr:hypothetical protein [Treponema sp.]
MKTNFAVLFLTIILISVSACITKARNTNEAADIEQVLESDSPEEYSVIGGYKTQYLARFANIRTGTIYVTISEGKSADLSGIEQMPNIKTLHLTMLQDIKGIDFSPVRTLTKLKRVEIGGWGVTAIPDLGGLPLLTQLVIISGSLTSLAGIEKIPTLEYLCIGNNRELLADMSALQHLKNLSTISYWWGSYSIDFSVLKDLPKLETLDIGGGEVDFTGISRLKSLKKLSVEKNKGSTYKNIEEIGKMTWLKELELNTSIASVEFLAGNSSLEDLTLIAEKMRDDFYDVALPLDGKPLSNLKNLKRLTILGFEIGNFEIENWEALKNALPNLEYITTELLPY